jgi:alkylhydroperoxidase family enzyme
LQQEADAEGFTGFRGEKLVEAVLRDLDTAPLSEKEKALLRFVDKVNHHSPEITAADMQPLYAAGWTDEAIYYAITICALFNFYNRWVDASGVPALSDEAHRLGSKRSASIGYVRK